ncbi:MAG: phosphatidylserine decarboxylase family protein [Flavobacteriales bacterium]|nr:phosphatidylserine decarboxylase family protein [Flavobacteriales bacterium]
MRLHREGTPTLLLVAAVVCFGLFALLKWPVLPDILAVLIGAALIVVFGIVVWFFRVPSRRTAPDDNAIFSPCDGKVVVIEEVYEPEYFKDKRRQVSIFMSPLNVHINYHPIGGTTSYYKYHPGKYLVAWHPKSSTENERSTVVVRHPKHGEVLFRQIAGALARRICTYAKAGAPAVQGAEFGFIKFGSRVDLFLPLDASIHVSIGEVVTGSTSVIARYKQ